MGEKVVDPVHLALGIKLPEILFQLLHPEKLCFLISLATDFGKISVYTEVAFNKTQLISTFNFISLQHREKYRTVHRDIKLLQKGSK